MSERPQCPPSFHQERAAAPVYVAPQRAQSAAGAIPRKRTADRPTAGVTAFSGPREMVTAPPRIGPARNVLSVLAIAAIVALFIAVAHDARSRYEAVPPLIAPPCIVATGHVCMVRVEDGGEVTVSVGYGGIVRASTAVPRAP
jgi:hypothetical protein